MNIDYLKDRRVLVTGGAGFIGSNLTIALLLSGTRVRVLDNMSTGKILNLQECIDDIELIEGDIRNDNELSRALKGIEIVFHQAALPSVPRSIQDPVTSSEVNAQGTLKLLVLARDQGVERVVYASSSSVYGDSPRLPKEEIMAVDPKSPYALSKFTGERYCQLFTKLYGLDTISLRYFNVFGPMQDPESLYAAVIPRFITNVLGGKPISIYGNGDQTRDFTFVENVVNANILAAESSNSSGEVLNIACGERISIMELAKFIMKETGKEVGIERCPGRPGEIRDSLASIEKARALIRYEPSISVWEGLINTIDWYAKNHSPYSNS